LKDKTAGVGFQTSILGSKPAGTHKKFNSQELNIGQVKSLEENDVYHT
jgi:hypothetical protein